MWSPIRSIFCLFLICCLSQGAYGTHPQDNNNYWEPSQCMLPFDQLDVCVTIEWTDGPITLAENQFFVYLTRLSDGSHLSSTPKLSIRLFNYYENRDGLKPTLEPGLKTPSEIFIRNLFFDSPGYWILYFTLSDKRKDLKETREVRVSIEF